MQARYWPCLLVFLSGAAFTQTCNDTMRVSTHDTAEAARSGRLEISAKLLQGLRRASHVSCFITKRNMLGRIITTSATSACRSLGQRALATAGVQPLTTLTEDEKMLQDAGMLMSHGITALDLFTNAPVRRFAQDVVGPRVSDMDRDAKIDKEIVDGLFEQGLMGVEIPDKYDGTGSGFLAACLVVEELAKVS